MRFAAEHVPGRAEGARRRPGAHQAGLPPALLLDLRALAQHAAAEEGAVPLVEGHADQVSATGRRACRSGQCHWSKGMQIRSVPLFEGYRASQCLAVTC